MTRVQIIEQNGSPVFAVIPMDMWLKVRKSLEDIEDIAIYDAAKIVDDGFRIPSDVLNHELEGVHPIKAWREYKKITIEALAKEVGITKAHLSQIEKGKRTATVKTISEIAKKLGVPVDILIDGVEELKLAA